MAVGPKACVDVLRKVFDLQTEKFRDELGGKAYTVVQPRDVVDASVGQLESVASDSVWAIEAVMGWPEEARRVRLVPVLREDELETPDEGFAQPRPRPLYVPLSDDESSASVACAVMLVFDAPGPGALLLVEPDDFVAGIRALCAYARANGYLVPHYNETRPEWINAHELVLPGPAGGANRACLARFTYRPADSDKEFLHDVDARIASHGIVLGLDDNDGDKGDGASDSGGGANGAPAEEPSV